VAHDLLFFEKEKKQKKDLTDRFFVGYKIAIKDKKRSYFL